MNHWIRRIKGEKKGVEPLAKTRDTKETSC
jgi:hypothetical protein